MIYTITFNPSLDYVVTVPNFQVSYTNRCTEEEIFAGGKGINVSMVLRNLGHDSTALGFVAGFVGQEILARLGNINHGFIEIPEGNSRINMKIKNLDGTEINGMGPNIDVGHLEKFYAQLKTLNKKDILVLAGSIPSTMPPTLYQDILEMVSCERVVVDATGELLLNALAYQPFFIKPNVHELEEIFQVKIESKKDIIAYGKKLQEKGARNVLISRGGQGALLLDEIGEVHQSGVPKGTLVNAVGSGDSMVAGFLAGYLETSDYHHAFLKAIATGSGSAFSTHFATKELVESLLTQLMTK